MKLKEFFDLIPYKFTEIHLDIVDGSDEDFVFSGSISDFYNNNNISHFNTYKIHSISQDKGSDGFHIKIECECSYSIIYIHDIKFNIGTGFRVISNPTNIPVSIGDTFYVQNNDNSFIIQLIVESIDFNDGRRIIFRIIGDVPITELEKLCVGMCIEAGSI